MNIHYIVTDFTPKETGFAIAFKNFCNSLLEIDDVEKIFVYTHIKDAIKLNDKVEIVYNESIIKSTYFPAKLKNKLGVFIAFIYLYKWLKSFKKCKDDLFIIESIYLVHIAYILKKLYPKHKIILRIHGTFPEIAYWNKDKFRLFSMKLLEKIDNIAVTTYHYIEYLNTHFKPIISNNRKYYILPNTLPDNTIMVPVEVVKPIRFLQLGRMDKFGYFQKAFQDVLQALYYLEETLSIETLKGIEYIIIGNGDLSDSFRLGIEKLKYIKAIYYLKLSNDEVQEKIDQSHVILLPSRVEGMSMFATEVLAKGKAFIATTDGGMRDMVFDKVNSISVRPFDYIDIANAIVEYIENPEIIENYGKNSRIIFESKFSYTKFTQHFRALLRDVR